MLKKYTIGTRGEKIAKKYLIKQGLRLISSNERILGDEIDLVFMDDKRQKKEIVFVEVKTRTNNKFGGPLESIDKRKGNAIRRGIENYIKRANWKGFYRLDVLSVIINDNETQIEHIKDVMLD